MKKILFSLAIVSLFTLAACSDEESLPKIAYTGCTTCEVSGVAPDFVPEDYEICVALESATVGDSTAQQEVVYVNGRSTGIAPERYFELFCDNAYGEVTNPEPGEGEGGGGGGTGNENCVTCLAFTDATTGTQVAQQEVCQGTNGNAYLGNTDTGLTYANYIAAMNILTTCQ